MGKNTHLKQTLKHSHNQNWQDYVKVLRKLGLYESFHYLPEGARAFIRKARFSSVRIEATPGDRLDRIIEAARKDFHNMLCTETVQLPGTGQQFTLHEILVDVYSCVLATCNFFNNFTNKPLGGVWTPAHRVWLEKVVPFSDYVKFFDCDFDSPFKKKLNQLSNEVCTCDRGYYWFGRRHVIPIAGSTLVRIYQLRRQEPQTQKVTLDGKVRTVYRLAGTKAFEDLKWISISAERLGIKSEHEYPVYVQMHVLDRARQRLFPLNNSTIGQLLVNACLTPEIEFRNNFYQMVVRLDGCKVGYLLLSLCKNILVGRTFLFVTQSGCPEGQAINERFGIGAYEKEYLKIDHLATFLQSDILHDNSIAALLTECGCKDLVGLKKHAVIEKTYAAHLRKILCLDECAPLEDTCENVLVNEVHY